MTFTFLKKSSDLVSGPFLYVGTITFAFSRKIRIFCQKPTKFVPKLAFWDILGKAFPAGALLVGWLVVVIVIVVLFVICQLLSYLLSLCGRVHHHHDKHYQKSIITMKITIIIGILIIIIIIGTIIIIIIIITAADFDDHTNSLWLYHHDQHITTLHNGPAVN